VIVYVSACCVNVMKWNIKVILFHNHSIELRICLLQDPKNKQFAICNDELLKVFGECYTEAVMCC
jgi:hypothetical protein